MQIGSNVSLARVKEPNDAYLFTNEWEISIHRLGELSGMAAHFVHGIGYIPKTYLALCRPHANPKARRSKMMEYAGMANAYVHFNPLHYEGNGVSLPVFGVHCQGPDDGIERIRERLVSNGFVEVCDGLDSVVDGLDKGIFSGREGHFIQYFEAITGHLPTKEAMQEFWRLNPEETRRFWQF